MKNYVKLAIFILISCFVISCSVNKTVSDQHFHSRLELDSLQYKLLEQNKIIDSLYYQIDELTYTTDSLYLALEISNSRIAINTDFQIPDSIVFAGRTFDLRNERIFDKFEKIYNSELKSAHKFIPRSGKYFALFDSIFAQHEIPLDAKYLAIAESRLSSLATSRVGAVGIWQFMEKTAQGFNLKINSFIDERRDVFKATEAAARYLKHNYNYLADRGAEDWLLAMSAYNAGAGSISKTMRNQNGYDFFDLILKSDESHKYVWRAVATKLIFENEVEIFGNKFERNPPLLEVNRLVELELKGHYKIDDWAVAQGTTINKVWELNPWIKIYQRRRNKYSPVNDVILPPGNYRVILSRNSEKKLDDLVKLEKQFLNPNAGYFTYHLVKKGDTLYDIARKYKSSIAKIKSLNGLRSNVIYPGQKLKLYGNAGLGGGLYTVRKGDTIADIAVDLGVSSKHLISMNKLTMKKGIVIINPGQRLYY